MKNKIFANSNSGGGGLTNKAFTLIELLAIIVILAIIAVITVPIILGIIDEAKEGTITDSAYGYKDAIQNYSMHMQTMDSSSNGLNGSYTVEELKTLGLEVSGNEPDSGIVLVDNNGITGCLVYDEYKVNISNNKVVNTSKGNCPNIKLATSGDGLYESTVEPGRYIYRGANPNNYITLNEGTTSSPSNVTYRIISYENDGTIKVIRDTSIGDIAWDERTSETAGPRKNTNNTYCNYSGEYYGCNVWGNTSNILFNGSTLGNTFNYKYYANNASTELTNSTNTGTVTVDSTLNQYLNNTWITNKEMSKYIDNHDFNVGGIYYHTTYPASEAKTLSQEKEEQNIYTWNGKIGLMNITDYVSASTNSTCTSVYSNFYYNTNYYYDTNGDGKKEQTISGYDNWPCSNRSYNWMAKAIIEWSLSPFSSTRASVWRVNSSGTFDNWSALYAYRVRPAFYLKSSVVLTGSGTSTDLYRIAN